MDRRFIEPYQDMFNICNLIKKTDGRYRLYFDKKNKSFLIVNPSNNYEVCMEFKNFSEDILGTLQSTQVKNSVKIFENIEKHNAELSLKLQRKAICEGREILSEKIKTLSAHR